jgi:rhodanese-related sulfurtransferase
LVVSIISILKVEAAVKDKNTNIIVYCSIGVRSEQIGEKLKN